MTIEALWSVQFITTEGATSGGIAVFDRGRIAGGDAALYYTGSYTVGQRVVHVSMTIKRHMRELPSFFYPLDDFEIRATGKVGDNTWVMTGFVMGAPERRVAVHFTRLEDLPPEHGKQQQER